MDYRDWEIIEIREITDKKVILNSDYGLGDAEVNPTAFGQIPIKVGTQLAVVGEIHTKEYNEDYYIDSFTIVVKLC